MGRLRLGDVTVVKCDGHRQKARSVAWDCTGTKLASASIDRLAKIWNIEGSSQGREIMTVGHTAGVERVRWHPTDTNILCTAAADSSVQLWDMRMGSSSILMKSAAKINLVHKHSSFCPASVEWHPDGRSLVVAEKDNLVHVYDLRGFSSRIQPRSTLTMGPPSNSYRLQPNVVHECVFSPNGNHLVAACKATDGRGIVRIWQCSGGDNSNSSTEKPTLNTTQLVGHIGSIYCLRFSPCGNRLATGGIDALVGLWDTNEMICTHAISRLNKFVRSVSFSHDSRLLASSSEERFIDIADADTGERVGEISARYGADEMAWNPKTYALAFASGEFPGDGDGSMRLGSDSASMPGRVTVVKVSVASS